ncbi:MAG: tyrosine-type recombinase/integrase [Fimbriimonadaceae bacterium]
MSVRLPNGKRKRLVAMRRTKTEALAALEALKEKAKRGEYAEAGSMRLSAFLRNWLSTVVEPNRAPKTVAQYRYVVSELLEPALGSKRLDDLRRSEVQAFLAGLSERGLARNTVRAARAVLSSAYTEAVRRGLAGSNPAKGAEVPRNARAARERTALRPEQAARLLDAAEGTEWSLLLAFLLFTGCRIGEATGLRWEDVDTEGGTARIRGQLQRVRGALRIVPSTKTGRERTVAVPESLTRALESTRLLQSAEGIGDPEGVVFLTAEGRRVDPKTFNAALRALCRKAGVPEISAHCLRHTAATLALAQTGDLHATQKALGHSQVALTADLYGHALLEPMRRVAEGIERAVREARDGR